MLSKFYHEGSKNHRVIGSKPRCDTQRITLQGSPALATGRFIPVLVLSMAETLQSEQLSWAKQNTRTCALQLRDPHFGSFVGLAQHWHCQGVASPNSTQVPLDYTLPCFYSMFERARLADPSQLAQLALRVYISVKSQRSSCESVGGSRGCPAISWQ